MIVRRAPTPPPPSLPPPLCPQVYVDRLGSNIQVVRRNSNSCRRIALHGSDGSLRTFLIQSSQVGAGCGGVGWWGWVN
jgi:hypothetical protein